MTGRRSSSYNVPAEELASLPVEQRLFHEADSRAEALERARGRLEAAELAKHSFAPQVNRAANAAMLDLASYRPIHERLGELQRAKVR